MSTVSPGDVLTTRRLTRAQRQRCPPVGVYTGERVELLAQLCFPLSPAAFLKRHWRQQALAVHGSRRRTAPLVREMLHGLRLRRLLADTPSEEVHVWFASASGGNESFKTADRDAAMTCHRAGGSLYFRAPVPASELLVTALSQQVGLSFGALHPDGAPRSEVETFVSRAGHVTDWHFDFMENFTLQLSGSKTWYLKRSSVAVPARGCTPQWTSADAAVTSAAEQQAKLHAQHAAGSAPFDPSPPASFWEGAEKVTLRAGSVLYVPAGVWHRVECVSDSTSINVSLMGSSWADLVADALRQRLLAHACARAPVTMRSVPSGRRELASLLELAGRELGGLLPSDLLPSVIALPRVEKLSLPPPEAEVSPPPASNGKASRHIKIGRSTTFRRNPLAVLLRLPAAADDGSDDSEAEGEVEGEAEGGAEGEEEGEEEGEAEGMSGAKMQPTRCGGGERLGAADDLFIDATRGSGGDLAGGRYAVHSNFGNEEFGSLLRVEMHATPRLVPLLEWCRAAPATFTAAEALAAAGGAVKFKAVAGVLRALEHNGYCAKVSKALTN